MKNPMLGQHQWGRHIQEGYFYLFDGGKLFILVLKVFGCDPLLSLGARYLVIDHRL